LREKDGVPDLRLGARSKYASVDSPEVCLISAKDLQWYLIFFKFGYIFVEKELYLPNHSVITGEFLCMVTLF
jgi:hypothetical protein